MVRVYASDRDAFNAVCEALDKTQAAAFHELLDFYEQHQGGRDAL